MPQRKSSPRNPFHSIGRWNISSGEFRICSLSRITHGGRRLGLPHRFFWPMVRLSPEPVFWCRLRRRHVAFSVWNNVAFSVWNILLFCASRQQAGRQDRQHTYHEGRPYNHGTDWMECRTRKTMVKSGINQSLLNFQSDAIFSLRWPSLHAP